MGLDNSYVEVAISGSFVRPCLREFCGASIPPANLWPTSIFATLCLSASSASSISGIFITASTAAWNMEYRSHSFWQSSPWGHNFVLYGLRKAEKSLGPKLTNSSNIMGLMIIYLLVAKYWLTSPLFEVVWHYYLFITTVVLRITVLVGMLCWVPRCCLSCWMEYSRTSSTPRLNLSWSTATDCRRNLSVMSVWRLFCYFDWLYGCHDDLWLAVVCQEDARNPSVPFRCSQTCSVQDIDLERLVPNTGTNSVGLVSKKEFLICPAAARNLSLWRENLSNCFY